MYQLRGVQGNTTKLNGKPCAWCGRTNELDFETRFDCEEGMELFTLHRNCYKKIVRAYPETDVMAVLYQRIERRMNEQNHF